MNYDARGRPGFYSASWCVWLLWTRGRAGGRAGDGLMCTAVDIITFYNYFSVGSRVVNSNSPRGNIRSGSAIYTLVGWHKTKSTTIMRVCGCEFMCELVCVC